MPNTVLEYLHILHLRKPHGYKRTEEGGMQNAAVGLKRYKMAVCVSAAISNVVTRVL